MPSEGGGRGRPMMFAAADVDAVRPPKRGAPVRGDQGAEAWTAAAETVEAEIRSLPARARRQFLDRIGREFDLLAGRGISDFGLGDVARGVRRLRTTRTQDGQGFVFNLELVKAHVMRDLLRISHAKVAAELQVSTTTVYGLLGAWKQMLETGQLPVEDLGEVSAPARPVPVDPAVVEKIDRMPAEERGEAYLREARKLNPHAVRTTGRRSRTLSSREEEQIEYMEATVAPQVMASAISSAYSGDDAWDDDDMEGYDDGYEFDEALDMALDADDAGLEEYEAQRAGRPWPTPVADPCVCGQRGELRGSEADLYVQEHLIFISRDAREIGLFVCPGRGRRWHQDWPHVGPSGWGDTRLRQLR